MSDLLAPTSTVQLRFIATDDGNPSTIEAMLDDVTVTRRECTPCDTGGTGGGILGPGTNTVGAGGQGLGADTSRPKGVPGSGPASICPPAAPGSDAP